MVVQVAPTDAGRHARLACLDGCSQITMCIECGEYDSMTRTSFQEGAEPQARQRAIVHHHERDIRPIRGLHLLMVQSQHVRQHAEHDKPASRHGRIAETGELLSAEPIDELPCQPLAIVFGGRVVHVSQPAQHAFELPVQRFDPGLGFRVEMAEDAQHWPRRRPHDHRRVGNRTPERAGPKSLGQHQQRRLGGRCFPERILAGVILQGSGQNECPGAWGSVGRVLNFAVHDHLHCIYIAKRARRTRALSVARFRLALHVMSNKPHVTKRVKASASRLPPHSN